jgi:hypothetical protein
LAAAVAALKLLPRRALMVVLAAAVVLLLGQSMAPEVLQVPLDKVMLAAAESIPHPLMAAAVAAVREPLV